MTFLLAKRSTLGSKKKRRIPERKQLDDIGSNIMMPSNLKPGPETNIALVDLLGRKRKQTYHSAVHQISEVESPQSMGARRLGIS